MKHLIFNQFNLIKIFCCFLVVFQHIVGRFLNTAATTTSTHLIYGTLLNFSRFAVPIFLLITGFVIIKSYENLSLKQFYKTKFSKILYIYIGANLLFMIPKIFMPNYSVELFITDFIFGKAQSHLWYMNTLIKIYLFFPIFKYIVIYLNKWLSYKSIILITIVQYFISENAYTVLSKATNPILSTTFTYLDRSLLIWGYYIILGGLVYKNFDKIYSLIQKYKIYIITAFSLSLIYINLYTFNKFDFTAVNYYRSSPSSFRILIYSILSIIVLYYIANFIVQKDNFKILLRIKRFSKYILQIYITHPIIITFSTFLMPLTNKLPFNLNALIIISLVITASTLPFYIYEITKKQKSLITR
ncbi:acyltransferase [uncultured Clostridium sp.]|jgi:surface polysaccharide O-acyltransferase-like enzyme|uniref:acyltransferase family protein n=1 Tax=uncultured Clostridium sp. TaxID=59620 RepID=UPI0026354DF3|nr:acyltransferase [uncultured Clostridium sp.]